MNVEEMAHWYGGITPINGAQNLLACARLTNDATGERRTETIVLPNMICILSEYDGVLIGQHLLASEQYTGEFIDRLAEECTRVTECDCPKHEGNTLAFCDPSAES